MTQPIMAEYQRRNILKNIYDTAPLFSACYFFLPKLLLKFEGYNRVACKQLLYLHAPEIITIFSSGAVVIVARAMALGRVNRYNVTMS